MWCSILHYHGLGGKQKSDFLTFILNHGRDVTTMTFIKIAVGKVVQVQYFYILTATVFFVCVLHTNQSTDE